MEGYQELKSDLDGIPRLALECFDTNFSAMLERLNDSLSIIQLDAIIPSIVSHKPLKSEISTTFPSE